MEIRPIDGNALAEELRSESLDAGFYRAIYEGAARRAQAAPILDYAPVVHGEWIESTVCVGFYECSQCRSRKRGNQPFFDSVWNYCPNCGAKMDGGKKDGKNSDA